MRKRQWKVGVLTEFFPANANLLVPGLDPRPPGIAWRNPTHPVLGYACVLQGLNYNRGQEIRIRLRPADREAEFLPFESLLGTMLHELTHIGAWPALDQGRHRGTGHQC